MIKPLPSFDAALMLPPVAPDQYRYFEHGAAHPFDASAAGPTLGNAWWLGDCALAAYADAGMATEIFKQGGLGMAGGAAVPGHRLGGQCYVVADDRLIIVAFRGTQVVKREHAGSLKQLRDRVRAVLRDLLTDAKVRLVPWSGRSGGRVHQGFAEAVNELLPGLSARIGALRRENPERRLWLTGHSLGAALATLAADRLEGVQGLHTFGSPQVGDATFAANFAVPGWRFRNHTDAVAWVPSAMIGYRHVTGGRYFDRHRKLQNEPGVPDLLKDGLAGASQATARCLAAISRGQWAGISPEALDDHSPIRYAILTWNAHIASQGEVGGPG